MNMNTPKPIMSLPNAFKLDPDIEEQDEDGCGLPTVYLRSAGTEAFRIRIDAKTRFVIASLKASYGVLLGKTPSLSLLVRRALMAHLVDTIAVVNEGSEAERRGHAAKLLGGQA